jgi:uncharacterized protein (DUF2384 family)
MNQMPFNVAMNAMADMIARYADRRSAAKGGCAKTSPFDLNFSPLDKIEKLVRWLVKRKDGVFSAVLYFSSPVPRKKLPLR